MSKNKTEWLAPTVIDLNVLPTTLGDCEGGTSETPGACSSGGVTGLLPDTRHACTGGGVAGNATSCKTGTGGH